MWKSPKRCLSQGTGPVAWQEIRIAATSLDQWWPRIGAHQELIYYNQKQRSNKESQMLRMELWRGQRSGVIYKGTLRNGIMYYARGEYYLATV